MNILYLCPDPGVPVLGRKGASVHVRELIGALAAAGHRVTLAAQTLVREPADEPAKVRARVIQVPPDAAAAAAAQALKEFNGRLGLENSLPRELRRILHNQAFYRELKRRFLAHPPDFIYERASIHAVAGTRLAEKLKVPHIVELNAPLAAEQSAYRATGFGDLAAQAERWTLTRADAVIVVSNELRRHALSLGVRPGRIQVMPNGVNAELFHPNGALQSGPAEGPGAARPDSKGRRRAPDHSGARATLGFVGGLRPWHGVEALPIVLERLSRRHPDARLVVAGDGQLRGELARGFRTRGLARRVRFTGALPHEQVPDVVRSFDIALAPYPRHDHDFYFSPLKLFEYMACAVPVVAADLGQISEVVTHGRTGLLYPPGDLDALVARCERLLDDPALRADLGSAAARLVHRKFTWAHNAARVEALAKKLIRQSRR
jgi:glycosyltransferase involved in cell wall biosynthesis